MSPDAGVRMHLSTAAPVTALVSVDNMACGILPEEDSFPAILCIAEPTEPQITMSGPAGINRSRVRVDSYAKDTEEKGGLASAKEIASAVAKALHCFRGTWKDSVIQGVFLEEQSDLEPDTDAGLFGVTQQFVVWHS